MVYAATGALFLLVGEIFDHKEAAKAQQSQGAGGAAYEGMGGAVSVSAEDAASGGTGK